MKHIKLFVRCLYAIPIFLIKVFCSLCIIPVILIFYAGAWAHDDLNAFDENWISGLKQLWGMDE